MDRLEFLTKLGNKGLSMGHWVKVFLSATLAGVLVYPASALPSPQQQQQQPQGQPDNQKPEKELTAKQAAKLKQKKDKELFKELNPQYKKWLDEDVVYIISSEERSAFVHLQTNEEREQFIEAFWQRRNPDPDSPENTFK
jgi:hypothetical protein